MATSVMDRINREGIYEERSAGFSIGDSVKVHAKVREGDKERIQVFGGIVIARDGGGATETFTVRRISHGVGVERVFPLHSRSIERIEIERRRKTRKAKLYYMRDARGTKMRVRSRD